jgi:hypothetical protein
MGRKKNFFSVFNVDYGSIRRDEKSRKKGRMNFIVEEFSMFLLFFSSLTLHNITTIQYLE